MEKNQKFFLTEAEKNEFIEKLSNELIFLRTKAGVSQEDLAEIIGVSRQTYGSFERKTRTMTWNTYLSLILFFDNNHKTHNLLRSTGVFPYKVFERINKTNALPESEIESFLEKEMGLIINKLDEQALQSLRTMIMIEYARCTQTPGDVVIKSFDGTTFNLLPSRSTEAALAFKSIKESKNNKWSDKK